MSKQLVSFFAGALVASLVVVVAMSFFGSTEAAASVSAPVASQSTPLELDQSGLPKGSLVFYLDGATCVAVPGIGVSCFCCEPCEELECEELECEECAPCDVANTTAYTSTSASGAYTSTVEVPSSASVSASSDGSSNGSEEPPAVVFVDDDDDTPSTGEPEPPAVVQPPKGNNGLGNGVDPAPPGIAKQGKPQNDDPAVPGDPQYRGKGSDGEPNGKGEAPGQNKDKGKGK